MTVGFLILAAGAAAFFYERPEFAAGPLLPLHYRRHSGHSGLFLPHDGDGRGGRAGGRPSRYVDWLLTTPLLLLDLALLALAVPRRRVGLIATLMGVDVFMIQTGWLAGSGLSGFGRGFSFWSARRP